MQNQKGPGGFYSPSDPFEIGFYLLFRWRIKNNAQPFILSNPSVCTFRVWKATDTWRQAPVSGIISVDLHISLMKSPLMRVSQEIPISLPERKMRCLGWPY